MRPIVLASALLLVLSGCAAAEPELIPEAQTTQGVEKFETQATQEAAEASSAEATESSEPESSDLDSTEQEGIDAEGQASDDPEVESALESQSTETSESSPTETQEPEPEPSQVSSEAAAAEAAPEPEIVGYTLAEVAQRNTASDCWVVIDGGVFDLTLWISSHPGGAGAITQLCGTDGTQQFLGMHGGQSRPSSTLDGYYIGPLR